MPVRSLKAGLSVSLSGQFRVQGAQALAGLQAWAEDVNRLGGVHAGAVQRPVSVVLYDDESRAERARLVTKRLITEDRVDLLFGPYSAGLTTAAVEVAEEHGRLLWNQGGASDAVYRQGHHLVVGILTPATEYLAGLLPLVRRAAPEAKSIAILRASTGAFPRTVSAGVEDRAAELGFQVERIWEFEASITDFRPLLNDLASNPPDVLVGVGRIRNDLLLARQIAECGMAINAAALVATPIRQFIEEMGDLADGFIGPSQWEPSGSYPNTYGPTGREVLESLARRGQQDVDYPMVQSYAAGLVAQKCLEHTGTADDQALRDAAGQLEFSTFYGKFKIDPDTGRQIGHSVVLVQWQQGRKVIVWPSEQAERPLAYPWRTWA